MQEAPSAPNRARRRFAGLFLVLLVVAALALVAIPIWLIRPFAPQTPEGIAVAYALRRSAPWATVLAAAIVLFLAAGLWRHARWWSRALLVLAFVPLLGAAWFAQRNIFEKMFAPLADTRSAPAAAADWVEAGDPVLAVALNGEAAAYPVRQVAYHHIVHDVVGGVPVAVTY
jgi:thiol:disulfide interchange protein